MEYRKSLTGILRTAPKPFEADTIHDNEDAAITYASTSKVAYPGQILAVKRNKRYNPYMVNNGTAEIVATSGRLKKVKEEMLQYISYLNPDIYRHNETVETLNENFEDYCNVWDSTEMRYLPYFETGEDTEWQSRFLGMINLVNTPEMEGVSGRNFESCFEGCKSLVRYSIAHAQVTNAKRMFYDCRSLKDFKHFPDMVNAEDMDLMFWGCESADFAGRTIRTAKINTVTSSGEWITVTVDSSFENCTGMETSPALDLGAQTGRYGNDAGPQGNAPMHVNLSRLFAGCTSLKNISDIRVTNLDTVSYLFENCTSLEAPAFTLTAVSAIGDINAYVYSASFKYTLTLDHTFSGCTSLKNISGIKFVGHKYLSGWSFKYTFSGCTSLKNISGLDLTDAHDIEGMFENCTSLENADGVTIKSSSMKYVFSGCTSLKKIPDWDLNVTSNNLKEHEYTYMNCTSLTSVVWISNKNTLSAMTGTFKGCTSLKDFTMQTDNTVPSRLTEVFAGCTSLEEVTFTCGVKDSGSKSSFSGCASLKNINVSQIVPDATDFSYLSPVPYTGLFLGDSPLIDIEQVALLLADVDTYHAETYPSYTIKTYPSITLHPQTIANMTEETAQIITNKGWSILSA